jgi:hypothetical protein
MAGGGVMGQRGSRGAALAAGDRRAVGGAGGTEPLGKRCDDDDAQLKYRHHREEDSVARSPYHATRDPQLRRYVLVRWEKKVKEREGDSLAFVLPHEETDAVGSGSLTFLLAPSNRLAMNIFVLCEHKVFLSMRATPAQLNFFVIIVISLVAYIEWEHIRCN